MITRIAVGHIYDMTIPLAKEDTDYSLTRCQGHSSIVIYNRKKHQRVHNDLLGFDRSNNRHSLDMFRGR